MRFSTPHRKKANGDKERRKLPGGSRMAEYKTLAGKGNGYQPPTPRWGRCWLAGVAFLIQLLEEGGVVEGAGQSFCFSFNENGESMRKAIAKRESVR